MRREREVSGKLLPATSLSSPPVVAVGKTTANFPAECGRSVRNSSCVRARTADEVVLSSSLKGPPSTPSRNEADAGSLLFHTRKGIPDIPAESAESVVGIRI